MKMRGKTYIFSDRGFLTVVDNVGQRKAMPANLPPQYFEAEKRFRFARSNEEKVEALEDMLSIMPKHKGTDKLRAELRSKIARLTDEAERKHGASRKGSPCGEPR